MNGRTYRQGIDGPGGETLRLPSTTMAEKSRLKPHTQQLPTTDSRCGLRDWLVRWTRRMDHVSLLKKELVTFLHSFTLSIDSPSRIQWQA